MKTQGRQFIDYATRIYRVVIRMAAVRAPGDGAVGPAAAGKGLMRRMAAAGSGKEECGSVGLMCEWGAGAQNFGFCGGRARRAGGGRVRGRPGWIINEFTPRKIFGKWEE